MVKNFCRQSKVRRNIVSVVGLMIYSYLFIILCTSLELSMALNYG
jgi:hypothetical protein